MSSDPGPQSGKAFDRIAAQYDTEATDALISRWVRGLVWERLARLYQPGDHVLEIGCGSGEDAVWLAGRGVYVTASDVSPAMLDETARKAQAAGVADRIETRLLDLAAAATWDLPDHAFAGAYSNYGPLNCIDDWRALGATLARVVRPGGRLGFAVMGPFCLWETLWHGLHGHLRTAARRWRGQAVATIGGVSFPVWYPTPARLRRDLGPGFRRVHLRGLGVFLPPSDVYGALARRVRLARLLLRLERLSAARWPFKYLADHYWMELARV